MTIISTLCLTIITCLVCYFIAPVFIRKNQDDPKHDKEYSAIEQNLQEIITKKIKGGIEAETQQEINNPLPRIRNVSKPSSTTLFFKSEKKENSIHQKHSITSSILLFYSV
jgi:hypothetical protein